MVNVLISKGFDVNIQNPQGNTPLHYAISGGWIKLTDTLIKNGANENLQNYLGQVPWELKNE